MKPNRKKNTVKWGLSLRLIYLEVWRLQTINTKKNPSIFMKYCPLCDSDTGSSAAQSADRGQRAASLWGAELQRRLQTCGNRRAGIEGSEKEAWGDNLETDRGWEIQSNPGIFQFSVMFFNLLPPIFNFSLILLVRLGIIIKISILIPHNLSLQVQLQQAQDKIYEMAETSRSDREKLVERNEVICFDMTH